MSSAAISLDALSLRIVDDVRLAHLRSILKACQPPLVLAHKSSSNSKNVICVRTRLLNDLHDKLQLIARRCNERNPLVALSPAVFRAILSCLRLADFVTISRTCHRLHSAICDMPDLWSDISDMPFLSLGWRLALAARSAPAPLAFRLAFDNSNMAQFPSACRFLEQNASRLKSLRVDMPFYSDIKYYLCLGGLVRLPIEARTRPRNIKHFCALLCTMEDAANRYLCGDCIEPAHLLDRRS